MVVVVQVEIHGGGDVEERGAAPDGVVEAPFLAHVRAEHAEPLFPLHRRQHPPRLACHGREHKTYIFLINPSWPRAVRINQSGDE